MRGDPGDATYHSIEATWQEGGAEQRWFAYLHSDGATWWSDEMRIYDGLAPGEWQTAHGDLAAGPVAEPLAMPCLVVAFDGGARPDGALQQDARLVLQDLRLTAFKAREAAASPAKALT